MADEWDPAAASSELSARHAELVCDAPLDKGWFAGVDNIMKNERCASWTTPPTRSTTGART